MVGSNRTSSCATPMAVKARSMAASSFNASSPAAPKAAKAAAKGKGKRGRKAVEEGQEEADGEQPVAAAKKVKA